MTISRARKPEFMVRLIWLLLHERRGHNQPWSNPARRVHCRNDFTPHEDALQRRSCRCWYPACTSAHRLWDLSLATGHLHDPAASSDIRGGIANPLDAVPQGVASGSSPCFLWSCYRCWVCRNWHALHCRLELGQRGVFRRPYRGHRPCIRYRRLQGDEG